MKSQLRAGLTVGVVMLAACARAPYTPVARAGLAGTSWTLERFQGSDGTVLLPDADAEYTLEFQTGNLLRARIDCNQGSATWTSSGPGSIELGPLDLTGASCRPGSLHDQILQQWSGVRSYAFKDGRLHLSVADGGTYAFEPTNDYRNETHLSISL